MRKRDKLKVIQEANSRLEKMYLKSKGLLKENDDLDIKKYSQEEVDKMFGPDDVDPKTGEKISDRVKRIRSIFKQALVHGFDSIPKEEEEWFEKHLNNIEVPDEFKD